MKNGFCKFKTEKLSIHDIIHGMFFEEVTINGVIGLVHRTSATLYSINGLGTTNFRAPRLSSYRCRQNKRKCIFDYYKPAVNFHDSSSGGNICIRDIGYLKETNNEKLFL
jgi:hypothetical protein